MPRCWVAGVVALTGCPSEDAGDGATQGADGASSDDGATTGGSTPGTTGGTAGPGPDSGESTDPGSSGDSGGAAWVPSHEVGDRVGRFQSVWGPSVDALYAVGGQQAADGSGNVGAMARFDGSAWSAVALPADVPTLNWVFGVGERRVVVGDQGTVLWRDGDRGDWTEGDCGTVLPLWGVWGAAEDDLWAVGGDAFNKDPVLCHFDGVAWMEAVLPTPSIETHALFKIWGTSADHVFAVGDIGWIVHFDGTEWVEQESGTTSDLISLWGSGPDDILAVGGRSNATLARWDGSAWSTTTFDDVTGLNGVWMDPAGEAVVAGGFGVLGWVPAGTLTLEEQEADTLLGLHAVFGVTETLLDGPLFAVGGSIDMPPPYVGVILRWPD